MTNSENVYYLKQNTEFPLLSPGREVELLTSEEIAFFGGKIPFFVKGWAPFCINERDRMKKRES